MQTRETADAGYRPRLPMDRMEVAADRTRPWMKERGRLLLVLFSAALVSKLPLLFTSQRMADGDEAIVGLMGLHVFAQHQHPLFLYGQNYDAGAGVVAHLAALSYTLAGISSISLKLAPLFVWIVLVLAVGAVLHRWIGFRDALAGGALAVLCPASVEWALKARGGHMLAALAVVVLVGIGMSMMSEGREGSPSRASWRAAAFGLCGAACGWFHPSAAPFAVTATAVVLIILLTRRRFREGTLVILSGGIAVGILLFSLPGQAYWNWQSLRSSGLSTLPYRLLATVLPGLFTPSLDWSIPPEPAWVDVTGWLWLIVWVGATVLLLQRVLRGRGKGSSAEALLLVATAWGGIGAMFVVKSAALSPYVLLPLYPLSCMGIAAAARLSFEGQARKRLLTGLVGLLGISGLLVHVFHLGPATIHGAGEQNRTLPAAAVTQILDDLERHQVRCVFSGSAMLQWNLIFESQEQVLARWMSPRDRWQAYVDAVNLAYREGRPVALLWQLNGDEAQIAALRREYATKPDKLTVIEGTYALLYDASRPFIASRFPGAEAAAPRP
jgi:hypothetical protein